MEHPVYHLFLSSPQPVSALFTTLPSVLVVGGRMVSEKAFAVKEKNDCLRHESRAHRSTFFVYASNRTKAVCSSLLYATITQSFYSAAIPDLPNNDKRLFLDGLAFSDVCLVCLVGMNPAQGEWNGVHQVVPGLPKVRIWLSAGIKQVAARSFHSPFVCATLTAQITSEVFL